MKNVKKRAENNNFPKHGPVAPPLIPMGEQYSNSDIWSCQVYSTERVGCWTRINIRSDYTQTLDRAIW